MKILLSHYMLKIHVFNFNYVNPMLKIKQLNGLQCIVLSTLHAIYTIHVLRTKN